ncbi:MAG: uracil-DNA glycosylase family protein [Saprospiraceae bacterium]
MKQLLQEIKQCKICEPHLDLGANPVVHVSKNSKIMVIGQAPGTRVHRTGIPWNDPSGKRLRSWLDVDDKTFYNTDNFAIMPMGFCYPGKGKSGDLPPRKECAPLWHEQLLEQMPDLQLTLLIGAYAQKYYLKKTAKKTLTATVANFESYLPQYIPLIHPSPRNTYWLQRNPWFEAEVIPVLRAKVKKLIDC